MRQGARCGRYGQVHLPQPSVPSITSTTSVVRSSVSSSTIIHHPPGEGAGVGACPLLVTVSTSTSYHRNSFSTIPSPTSPTSPFTCHTCRRTNPRRWSPKNYAARAVHAMDDAPSTSHSGLGKSRLRSRGRGFSWLQQTVASSVSRIRYEAGSQGPDTNTATEYLTRTAPIRMRPSTICSLLFLSLGWLAPEQSAR